MLMMPLSPVGHSPCKDGVIEVGQRFRYLQGPGLEVMGGDSDPAPVALGRQQYPG